jgi:hypothetical protein
MIFEGRLVTVSDVHKIVFHALPLLLEHRKVISQCADFQPPAGSEALAQNGRGHRGGAGLRKSRLRPHVGWGIGGHGVALRAALSFQSGRFQKSVSLKSPLLDLKTKKKAQEQFRGVDLSLMVGGEGGVI